MKATRKLVALFSAAVLALAAKAAAPSVVVNSVTPAYPYGTTVETKYTVTAGDDEGSYSLKFYATINNEVYDVTDTVSESEATRLNAGEHTVTWTAPSNKLDTNAGLALKVVADGAATGPETVAELKTYSDTTFATKAEAAAAYAPISVVSTVDGHTTALASKADSSALAGYVPTTRTVNGNALSSDVTITAASLGALTAHQDISGKADKATTLAGYGITDAYTKTETGSAITTALGSYSTTAEMNTAISDAVSDLATANSSTTYSGQPYMVIDLTTGSVTYEANAPEYYNAPIYKTTKMAFRRVPAGSYSCTTGAVYTANALSTNTAPDGVMTMAKDYYIAIFECTEAQYNAIMGSSDTTSMKPKATISWNAIRDSAGPTNDVPSNGSGVVAKLNKKTNLYFDLPTEAMWQVAAHAEGHPGAMWCYGNDETRLYLYGNVRSGTSAAALLNVGSRQPNQWGIYDMYGNVWEWCRDACPSMSWNASNSTVGAGTQTMSQTAEATGDNRVIRGGSCNSADAAGWSRSGSRARANAPTNAGWGLGFRLARIVQ